MRSQGSKNHIRERSEKFRSAPCSVDESSDLRRIFEKRKLPDIRFWCWASCGDLIDCADDLPTLIGEVQECVGEIGGDCAIFNEGSGKLAAIVFADARVLLLESENASAAHPTTTS